MNRVIMARQRSFLELRNAFRPFDAHFRRIMAPLNRRHEEGQRKEFVPLNDEERLARKTLQEQFMSLLALASLYAEGVYAFDTDSYNVRAGCVLLQQKVIAKLG